MTMTETRTLEEFRAKFQVEELKVLENRWWSWSVRPGQPTLGAGILSLNRHAGKFSEVTTEEMHDLAEMVGTLERAIKASFDHAIMNYLMLMMVDHHVHYHVIPRYDSTRIFAGRDWVDNGWPALPLIADSQHADDPGLLHLIQEKLKLELA
jgi:diadenosine tetraphosphate (Ap4A) HIT family hydrolase